MKFDTNPKVGYYQVGTSRYINKPQALIEATKINQFPDWNFNREVFDQYNWSVEPEEALLSIYKRRAQQIRDRYDYIRLEYSGGADSTTVLYSFVKNNIHIDEVVVRWPETGSSGVDDDPLNYKSENCLSEIRYAAMPTLKWLADAAPKTKITVYDYGQTLATSDTDESWIYQSREYMQPGNYAKHPLIGSTDDAKMLDSHQRVCLLWGIDKPKICIKDKKWYLYFMDIQANTSTPVLDDYSNVENVYFYWQPDMPELLAKQAHLIRNWFRLPSNKHLEHLIRWPNHSWAQRNTYEHLVKSLIYPEYDLTTFQTSKPTTNFYNEMDHFFYKNFQETHAWRVWQAGIKHMKAHIDPKYFNMEYNEPVGFVGFLSPFYYLGDADFVDSKVNVFDRF